MKYTASSKPACIPEGMFVFSKIQNSREDLRTWHAHFSRQGIQSRILPTRRGQHYVLCREGVEATCANQ